MQLFSQACSPDIPADPQNWSYSGTLLALVAVAQSEQIPHFLTQS